MSDGRKAKQKGLIIKKGLGRDEVMNPTLCEVEGVVDGEVESNVDGAAAMWMPL